MRARAWAVAVLVLGAFATGCDSTTPRPTSDAPTPRPRAVPEVVTPQERSAAPSRVRVDNQAALPARGRLERAIADLKAVGVWRPLTRHLAVVQILTRTGQARIPADGHLADAYWTALFEPAGAGGLCSIAVYTSAMRADLARTRAFYSGGLTGPPASPRSFWAAILAHELAHCLPGQPGERVARAWEDRALRLIGEI